MNSQQPRTLIDTFTPQTVVSALQEEIQTTHAIFFHQRKHTLAITTAHEVSADDNGAPVVGPGRPLTQEDEQALLDILMSRESQASIEILPPTVLFFDRSTLAWWLPSAIRPMYLRSHEGGLQTILTRWPSLVAMVRNMELHLAAVEGDERPTAATPIYHAPLPNVYGDSLVCTGSARLPLSMTVGDIAAWESVVFDSAFTHTNHRETLRAPVVKTLKGRTSKRKSEKRDDADASFWLARDGETQAFPNATLNPIDRTLAEWITTASGRGGYGHGRMR